MSYLSYAYVANTIQRTHMQFIRIITTGQEWTRMDRVNTKTKQLHDSCNVYPVARQTIMCFDMCLYGCYRFLYGFKCLYNDFYGVCLQVLMRE